MKDMVVIEWVDSKMSFNSWEDEEVEDFTLAECCTIGFIIKEDKQSVLLVSSYGEGRIAGKTIIPKGCIKSRRKLKR